MLKKIFYIILIVLGIIGLMASLISVKASTSIGWGTVLPGASGAVFVAYAVIHLKRPGNIIKIKPLRIAVIAVVMLGVLSFAAVEGTILVYQFTSVPSANANFVIVPGCGVFPSGQITLTLQNRLDTAYDYLSEHENVICLVSGGKGSNEPFPEAQAMKDYLVSKGVPASRIVEEPNSESTLENMEFSSKLMDELYPGKEKSAVIVTSGFHVFRAVFLADNNDMKASGLAAPVPWYLVINNYMREFVGVVHSAVFELK